MKAGETILYIFTNCPGVPNKKDVAQDWSTNCGRELCLAYTKRVPEWGFVTDFGAGAFNFSGSSVPTSVISKKDKFPNMVKSFTRTHT